MHTDAASPPDRWTGLAERYLGALLGRRRQVGARMVADFLQLEGWETYYLSADVPLLISLRRSTAQEHTCWDCRSR